LIGLKNELFLRGGLDTPNQLEFAEQIKFYVQSNSKLACSMRKAIATPDLPSGKSVDLRTVGLDRAPRPGRSRAMA